MAGTLKRIKVMMFIEDDKTGTISICDGLEYEGRNWLVPLWLEPADGESQQPERIIPLDRFPHQRATLGGADYMVNAPIPKAIWTGPTSPALVKQYGVVLSPPIRIATKRNLN